MLARQGVVALDDPVLGPTRQPGLALHVAGGPRTPAAPAPRVGEHGADPWGVRGQVTDSRQQASAVGDGARSGKVRGAGVASGDPRASAGLAHGPLRGVRILDLSAYIAGPLGPATLADLGADVIKVEGPEGEGLRGNHAGFLAWNRGKRCLAADLRTAEGREVVQRIAATADVVVENMRPGVADRLGVGYAALAAINPRLIYCYASAYGSDGPYRHKPGVDPLMQARSGIERAQGGPERPPAFLLVPVTDNTCAALNAAGVALALYVRERTGRGMYLETSLLQAAALVQSDPLLAYVGRPPAPANDYDQTGPGPLRRLYRCADGWLFLAAAAGPGADTGADTARWAALCAALALTDLAADARFSRAAARALNPYELSEALAAAFAALPLHAALARLRAAGVPAVAAIDSFVERFHAELAALDPALLAHYTHPLMGAVTQPGVLARLHTRPGAVQRPAPLLGEHTEELLREIGCDAARTAAMLAAGVVVQARA